MGNKYRIRLYQSHTDFLKLSGTVFFHGKSCVAWLKKFKSNTNNQKEGECYKQNNITSYKFLEEKKSFFIEKDLHRFGFFFY